MKEKEITILGKQITIKYNMAVQIAYEEITGHAFDTSALDKTSNTLALYYACILVNNPDVEISFDDLLEKASARDIKVLRESVLDCFTDWCQSALDEYEKPEGEEKPKNS